MEDQKETIRMIIADDHVMFLEGLAKLLKDLEWIKIIGTVTNGEEVLKLLATQKVDIVVTDIDMPVMDGLKLLKEIKKNYPGTHVLALTMHNEANVISTLFKQGVTGYILKNTNKEELCEAIRTVAMGQVYHNEEVKNSLLARMTVQKKESPAIAFPKLSKREIDVLKLIAKAYTQQQIAEQLFISENTVITHKRSLFSKFNVKNTAGLITSAMEKGLLD